MTRSLNYTGLLSVLLLKLVRVLYLYELVKVMSAGLARSGKHRDFTPLRILYLTVMNLITALTSSAGNTIEFLRA
jgi:hypothetical protein